MVVWEVPCESRSLPSLYSKARHSIAVAGFFLPERGAMVVFSELGNLFLNKLPKYHFIALKEVDSTNAYLKEYARSSLGPAWCIAELQTAGYGQRQRSWISNEDSLTFSMLCHFGVGLHELDGLSQMVGLTLVEVLNRQFGKDFLIKWPNDIYLNSKKLAGLLIEAVKYDEASCWLVIGVGLNASSVMNKEESDHCFEAAFLEELCDEQQKNIFLLSLAARLDELSVSFKQNALGECLENYYKYDYFNLDQEIIVYDTERHIHGHYKGLTQSGELLFESKGSVRSYRSGYVSVRAVDDMKV